MNKGSSRVSGPISLVLEDWLSRTRLHDTIVAQRRLLIV